MIFAGSWTRRAAALLFSFALIACASSAPQSEAPASRGQAMVTAANPHAVEAGLEILRAGGNAVDAAIAVSMVLSLVEPQSSGVGGGGFMLHYDAASEAIVGYDGRERAPAGATATMFLDAEGAPLAWVDAQTSGRAIGAPSLVAMLKRAHDEHGHLPWARLFEPAIRLADEGFAVSPRMHRLLVAAAQRGRLRENPAARAYLFDADGTPWPVGHVLRNPAYAATLRAIASQGPRALSEGPIADEIVAAAQTAPFAGSLTLADLQAVSPRRVEPVCAAFRVYRVCTMASPSSGNAALAILGLYQRARPEPEGAESVDDWAAFLWASRLAYADRDYYMADDAFVPVPTNELVAPAYLDERARLIDIARAPSRTEPGMPAGRALFERWGRDMGEESGTSHMSIVDAEGNAVSMTQTVESLYGAQRMAGGFMLNNQMTDFSWSPELNGRPVANAIAPGKAPRSSMSPFIVTDADGELVLVIGSPGGSSIIGYVARATIGILDWGMSPQDAIAVGNVVARSAPARLETQRLSPAIASGLRARGWDLQENASEESGLHAILVTPGGLVGGADPRREGIVGTLPAH